MSNGIDLMPQYYQYYMTITLFFVDGLNFCFDAFLINISVTVGSIDLFQSPASRYLLLGSVQSSGNCSCWFGQ